MLMSINENPRKEQSYTAKYKVYQQWRNAVYEALLDDNMDDEAKRWLECETIHRSKWSAPGLPERLPAKTNYVMVCSSSPKFHPKIVQKHTCGLRFCPTCAEMHSARLLKRYVPHITKLATDSFRFRLRHIVLTTPYSLHDNDIKSKYKQHQKNILKLFDELLGKTWRKKQGVLVGDEFGESGDKLHSHILHFGQYLAKEKITEAWLKVTDGECQINYVRAIDNDEKAVANAIKEVLKYCTKFWRTDKNGSKKMLDPYLIPKLAGVMKGQRRIRTYGLFYGIKKQEQEEKKNNCSDCGSAMKKIWRSDWNIFINTGMTWKEFDLQEQKNALDLIPANKSVSGRAKIKDKPPQKQTKLSFLDAIPYQVD